MLDVVYGSFNFALLGMILAILRSLASRQDPYRLAFRELALACAIMTLSDILSS